VDDASDVEENAVVANPQPVTKGVVCERFDLLGLLKIDQFHGNCAPNLVGELRIKLSQLSQRFGLPVDIVHKLDDKFSTLIVKNASGPAVLSSS
jgi:hypothetical protein